MFQSNQSLCHSWGSFPERQPESSHFPTWDFQTYKTTTKQQKEEKQKENEVEYEALNHYLCHILKFNDVLRQHQFMVKDVPLTLTSIALTDVGQVTWVYRSKQMPGKYNQGRQSKQEKTNKTINHSSESTDDSHSIHNLYNKVLRSFLLQC